MLFSPLEQFNILSFYDFIIFKNCDILYATFLIYIWSLFNDVFYNTFSFFNFSHIIFFDISFIFDLINLFFLFYLTTLSYIWSSFFSQLYFIPIQDNNNIIWNKIFNMNIDIICTKLGYFFTNIYFIILEFSLILKSFFFTYFFSFFFSLSTKDFSYLIFSFNLSTIWQTLVFFFISFLFLTITWKDSLKLVSGNSWQSLLELFYHIIFGVVFENAGYKAIKFFPLIFTTFIIILTCNVLGMIPYSFTVTSHLIITFAAALAIFTGINILGIFLHRKHFLSLFFPPGAPLALAPLLVLIEFVSYVFRVLSLSIRLFANLMSGHTLLKILASFSWGIVSLWGIFLLPIVIIFIITGLEMAIAFLQAYIFSVLLCIYLNDAFNLH